MSRMQEDMENKVRDEDGATIKWEHKASATAPLLGTMERALMPDLFGRADG